MSTISRRLIAVAAGSALALAAVAPAANAISTSELAQLQQAGVLKSIVVQNTQNNGPGSLRDALTIASDAASGVTTHITFAKAGTIKLFSAPPILHGRVIIDGTATPGYVAGGAPVVSVDFNSKQGLKFFKGADRSEVLGMSLVNAQGDAISSSVPRMTIAGNYLGLNPDGTANGNGDDGIHLLPGAHHTRIGTNPEGKSGWISNVISGNDGNGIVLEADSHVTIISNRIGTDVTGTKAMPNGRNGIFITAGSRKNTIGGNMFVDATTGVVNDPTGNKGTQPPTFTTPPLGNVISGNTRAGILVSGAPKNTIAGNFIGTTASGNADLGNGTQGIWLKDSPGTRVVGCTMSNQPFAYYNVLSGNGTYGIEVDDSNNTVIQGNFVGIGADNATMIGNGLDGIEVRQTSKNVLIGGPIPLGNVSSGNGANGLAIVMSASKVTSYNNFLGTFAFGGAAPNAWNGAFVTSDGGEILIRTTVASGNIKSGIKLLKAAHGVQIDPVIVGMSSDGSTAIPNGGDGITITGSAYDNVIGGTRKSVMPHTLASGNVGFGIRIEGSAHDNLVQDTYVGTTMRGDKAAANQAGGIYIADSAHHNMIGGKMVRPGQVNVIAGNAGNGVTLDTKTRGNAVMNNYIGVNIAGVAIPNSGEAVVNGGKANAIEKNTV